MSENNAGARGDAEGAEGAVEGVKGKSKEVAGTVPDNDDLGELARNSGTGSTSESSSAVGFPHGGRKVTCSAWLATARTAKQATGTSPTLSSRVRNHLVGHCSAAGCAATVSARSRSQLRVNSSIP